MRALRRMMLATVFVATLGFAVRVDAKGVPLTMTNQGRLFDVNDQPIEGSLNVLFSVYDSPTATVPIWSEQHDVTFDNGFYSVSLGTTAPFDTTNIFQGSLRYFGITIGTDAEMTPRSVIQSVPYAMLAGDVNGDIHPSSVSIGNMEVINNAGQWVGPTMGGATGATGPQEPAGAPGPQGAAGAAGATGAAGRPRVPQGPLERRARLGAGAGRACRSDGRCRAWVRRRRPGATGAVGPAGATGVAGPIGATGATAGPRARSAPPARRAS